MKRIVAIALTVLMIAALFVGCGGGSDSPVGKYYIKSIDGKSVKDAMSESAGGMDVEALLGLLGVKNIEELITLELKADGTAEMASAMSTELNAQGTWTQEGSKIIITVDGDAQEFTLSGNELTGHTSDGDMVFFKK